MCTIQQDPVNSITAVFWTICKWSIDDVLRLEKHSSCDKRMKNHFQSTPLFGSWYSCKYYYDMLKHVLQTMVERYFEWWNPPTEGQCVLSHQKSCIHLSPGPKLPRSQSN